MAWVYSQKTGKISHNGKVVATGYAGRGAGKNNPAMQNVKSVGPIPRGRYKMTAPVDDPVLGKYVIRLIPDPSNQMFGRSSFCWHGDSKEHPGLASHGCIIHARAVREQGWNSGDHEIEVDE